MRLLGVFLFVSPLLFIVTMCARENGWRTALTAFSVGFAVTSVVSLGAFLMTGGTA